MTKNNTKSKKKSVAIRVFNILFIAALVIAIIVPILMFTPVASSLKGALQGKDWAQTIVTKMNSWVDYHVVQIFHVSSTFRGHGKTFTSCFYVYLLALIALFCLFLIYLPFLFMHNEKVNRKTQAWRKVLCWLTFAGIVICTLGAFSLLYSTKLSNTMGSAYTWILTLGHKWSAAFSSGHKLNILVIERITSNHTVWAALWLGFFITLLEVIVLLLSEIGKSKEAIEDKKIEPVKNIETKAEAIATEDNSVPAPVAAATTSIEEPEEKKEATIREIALLNSLNPLYETKIQTLPDLDDVPSEEELEKDLSTTNEVVTEEAKENKVAVVQADEIATSTSPFEKTVTVLPGIDEWDADPWLEEDEDELRNPTEQPAAEEKTEEAIMEAVEQKTEDNPKEAETDNSDTEDNDLTAIAAPAEEEIPVEEETKEVIPEEAKTEDIKAAVSDEVKEEIVDNVVKGDVEESPVEEKTTEVNHIIAINDTFHDGLRPQEEANSPVEEVNEGDRTDKKQIVVNNEHKDIITPKADDKDTWIIDAYVPEAKPVEEKKEEAPVKEEPKPVQQTPRINPIGLKQFDPSKRNNRPAAPIGVINPIKKEEKVEEKPVEEKKPVIAPISGPLHSTEKSKHDKIEAVKARHVAFALKNYEVKTYEGDLTAEEAFSMGVTKVQPTVNPVFANQGKEPAWKEKRRQENIRKNGYGQVTTVDNLTGKPTNTISSSGSKKSFSIRDLAKSKKAETPAETNSVETQDKKISKPINPVNLKPIAATKPEEKKETAPFEAENPAPNFKPIAPIQHKDRKRPEIKPVDPMKSKK